MSQPVTLENETGTAIALAPTPDEQFMTEINRSILSGEITSERMNELLDIKKRIIDQKNLDAFNKAMSEMQPEIPIIGKDKKSNNGAYASYEAMMEEIAPIMGNHGFSLSFKMDTAEAKIIIHAKLSHRAGHFETVSIPLPLDTSGSKNNVQAMGSTISYGKRYAASMLLNIATKNEDDNGGGGVTFITDTEVQQIEDWIVRIGEENREAFLKHMKAEKVIHIKSADYGKALNATRDKARSLGVKA